MTTPEDVERAKREAMRGDVVTVRWVCKIYSNPATPIQRLCGHAFNTAITRRSYVAQKARTRCPSCGGMLTQNMDGCEEVASV